MIRAALTLLLALPGPATADPAAAAREAAVQVVAATERLDRAGGARERIAALTEVVRAYETGLASLREGLRAVAVAAATTRSGLAAREARAARLSGALIALGRAPAPIRVLHPGGPPAAARASMLLADAAPVLEAEAAALRADLDRLAVLRALEEAAMADLKAGLSGLQAAREALFVAVAEREAPIPAPDGEAVLALASRADTLAAFADALSGMPGPDASAVLTLPIPLPVEAGLVRGFRELDAAGVARPGWVLATAPGALVTAPAAASVRHAGPLLDYGLVIVLEPRAGALMVLAGLAEGYVRAGEVVAAGASLGLMGGAAPAPREFRKAAVRSDGASRSETLYVEARVDGTPVDPANWFATNAGTSEGMR